MPAETSGAPAPQAGPTPAAEAGRQLSSALRTELRPPPSPPPAATGLPVIPWVAPLALLVLLAWTAIARRKRAARGRPAVPAPAEDRSVEDRTAPGAGSGHDAARAPRPIPLPPHVAEILARARPAPSAEPGASPGTPRDAPGLDAWIQD